VKKFRINTLSVIGLCILSVGSLALSCDDILSVPQLRNADNNEIVNVGDSIFALTGDIYKVLESKAGETWLLVTSAFHMPRAVGCFRKVGWAVVPVPVDYAPRGVAEPAFQFNFAYGVGSLGNALHEYLGLLFYWLTDKTDALFPAPG